MHLGNGPYSSTVGVEIDRWEGGHLAVKVCIHFLFSFIQQMFIEWLPVVSII